MILGLPAFHRVQQAPDLTSISGPNRSKGLRYLSKSCLKVASIRSVRSNIQTAFLKGTPDILTNLDQKYWSDLGPIGLYGKLGNPRSFQLQSTFNVCYTKSGDIGLLVFQLTKLGCINWLQKLRSYIYRANGPGFLGGSPDILTYLDQKYWSDLGFIGLYGKLEAPGSFQLQSTFNVCCMKSGDIGL